VEQSRFLASPHLGFQVLPVSAEGVVVYLASNNVATATTNCPAAGLFWQKNNFQIEQNVLDEAVIESLNV
jgi:hypothetical protein